jgi:hypothetical protein
MPRTPKRRTAHGGQNQGQPGLVIDWQELEAFRASLPEYRQYETFRFLVWQWDIVKALYLLHKYERPQGQLRVAEAARAYGFDKPVKTLGETREEDMLEGSAGFTIDPQFAMGEQIDRERPAILALVQLPGRERPTPLLIDGLHRLYRAAQDQRECIPCYALSPEEEQLCGL